MDSDLLGRAVRLAVDNADAGQLPFGALVVRAGDVLATGVNTALRDHDPTAHAEAVAIRAACTVLGTVDLGGATVVSSCEPCAMCQTVAVAAGVARIVYAAPKEAVPDLPGPDDLALRMQAALRRLAPDRIVHQPIDGADEPFRRYLAARGRLE